jgi:hypothetical protein
VPWVWRPWILSLKQPALSKPLLQSSTPANSEALLDVPQALLPAAPALLPALAGWTGQTHVARYSRPLVIGIVQSSLETQYAPHAFGSDGVIGSLLPLSLSRRPLYESAAGSGSAAIRVTKAFSVGQSCTT